jgi:hypothetical protein
MNQPNDQYSNKEGYPIMSDPNATIDFMLQGKLSDELYCYECLSRIDDFTKYVIISPELLAESNDVLCENCYDPQLLTQLQEQE